MNIQLSLIKYWLYIPFVCSSKSSFQSSTNEIMALLGGFVNKATSSLEAISPNPSSERIIPNQLILYDEY